MRQRNDFFDILKGIAILLVVLGHSIQYFSEDWQTNPAFLCLIMFHMPLFMAISGYFLYPSITQKSIQTYTKKKTHQLLLPSCTFGVTTSALLAANDIIDGRQMAFYDYGLGIFHGLWYLVVLFTICILASTIHHFCKSNLLRSVTWIFICIAIQFTPSDLVFNGLKTLLPFATMALLFRNHNWEKVPWYLACLSLLVFWWSLCSYKYEDSMYAITFTAFDIEFWHSFFIRIIAGASGTIITMYMARYLQRISIVKKTLTNLGRVTLPIYVIQSYIFFVIMFSHIVIPSLSLQIIIGILITMLSVGSYKVLKCNQNLSFLIFGKIN